MNHRAMATETAIVTLPAFLENALLHGDLGGLDDARLQVYCSVIDHLEGDGWYVVERDDDGIPHEPRHALHFRLHFGADLDSKVNDYVCHRPRQIEHASIDRLSA
jgi:hypothetical protein